MCAYVISVLIGISVTKEEVYVMLAICTGFMPLQYVSLRKARVEVVAFMPELRGYNLSQKEIKQRLERIEDCKAKTASLRQQLGKCSRWKTFWINRSINRLEQEIKTHEHYIYYTWWEF